MCAGAGQLQGSKTKILWVTGEDYREGHGIKRKPLWKVDRGHGEKAWEREEIMAEQALWKVGKDYGEIDDYLREKQVQSIFLVCDGAISFLDIDSYFQELQSRRGIEVYRFTDFKPNPQYESVIEGVRRFREQQSDIIFAVGGGSAMDVAKCIKLYAHMDLSRNCLEQTIVPNTIPLAAIPTTAGTGSEATRYAVIYYQGEKQSVSHESCIPSAVFMDAEALRTLPLYQKKATMLDALCHGIESCWSVNATAESREYAEEAIRLILDNMDACLKNDGEGNANMLYAAHLAGKAINITQTTAGHAMCYKLTGLYGIAHGHAAALCVDKLWPYMIGHTDRCVETVEEACVLETFFRLGKIMGCSSPEAAARKFSLILDKLEMPVPCVNDAAELDYLTRSVNPVRLKNNPVFLSPEVIKQLYREILREGHS